MMASPLYRVASVLLAVFAIGHTVGFRRVDPKRGVDAAIGCDCLRFLDRHVKR